MPIITNIKDLDPNRTYSYADYLTWKFDEYVEIVKGKLLQMSLAPSKMHQFVLDDINLVKILATLHCSF